ncbi:MAG: hypothetical protein ACU85E_10320 [Gammaproteobacteria bacterium]
MKRSKAKQKVCNIVSSLGTTYLLAACAATPILRDFPPGTQGAGFVELDENTEPRFYRDPVSSSIKVGTLYVSGNNAYINRSQVAKTTAITNNAFVNTGSKSSVRIEFENEKGMCVIHIEEFREGKGYGDTTSCLHTIETTHADSQLQNSIYHFDVSPQQTEVTVLRGLAKLSLRSFPSQTINIHEGEEAILTDNSIIGPRPVPPDEITRRVRWRDHYQFFKSGVDWATVGAVAVGIAVVGGAIAAGTSGDDDDPTPPSTTCDPNLNNCSGPNANPYPVK